MNRDETGALFDSLLSADISDETREEIGGFARAFRAGTLDDDDLAYVIALADRLGVGRRGATRRSEPAEADPPDEATDLDTLRADRDALRRRVETLETKLATAKSGGDDKFSRAREAFARLYHPDNQQGESVERTVRTEVYNEFWAELEEIDKGG